MNKTDLAKERVRELKSHIIPADEVEKGENNPETKAEIVRKYKSKAEDVLITLDYVMENFPEYQGRREDKDLENDILFCRLAYGFQPDEYAFFALEKQSKKEREEWISDIDRYIYIGLMNDPVDVEIFNNKARTYEMFYPYYGRKVIGIKEESDFEKFSEFIESHPEFVKKKADESLGRTVELVRTKDISPREYFNSLISIGEHVIEERIRQGESTRAFNSSSVNTVRCITVNTRNGIEIPYTFSKTGRKGKFYDNAHAGGIVSNIDVTDGIIETDGFDEFGGKYIKHPDSGIEFKGFKMPRWDEMKELCTKLAEMIPSVKCIGWDMALTENGWVVVEGNWATQLVVPQIVVQKGLKREMTELIKQVDFVFDPVSEGVYL